jgi:hypothetical protein
MATKENSARLGVEDAWVWWLNEHCISGPEMMGEAIERAWTSWLDANRDEIIQKIVERVEITSV